MKGFTYTSQTSATVTCAGRVPTTGAAATRWNGTSDITECYGQDDAVHAGLDLSITGNFAARSSYRASLTQFTQRKNVEATTPRHIADLSVAHGMGNFTLTGALKHVSAYKRAAQPTRAIIWAATRVMTWVLVTTPN